MRREDDEQLWDLLGRVAERKVSPFFARNVLRQVRQQPRFTERVVRWLSWRQLVPASALAVAAIAAVFVTHHVTGPQSSPDKTPNVVAKIDPQDYEVVADLDDLLASGDNTLWDDNSTL
jgi:negative regulator of sigma E activity